MQVELGDELVGPDGGGWNITDRHVMRLWLARIVDGEPEPLVAVSYTHLTLPTICSV